MNILYLTNHLNTGGITSYVLRLSAALKKRGHNIFVASGGGELAASFEAQGISFIPIPIKTKSELSPKIIFSFFKLLPLLKKRQIQLIHCNSRTTQALGCLLSKSSGIPYISTCHGFFKVRLGRRIFPCWGKRVIAISEEVKEHLVNDFKVDEQRLRVVNHGVDAEFFSSEGLGNSAGVREKFGIGAGPVIGHIGRLSDVKGQRYLIQAMKRVLDRYPQAQLVIIGEGRMKQELVNLAQQLNIGANVFFIPRADDIREALSVMDVFVMPSIKEGLGLALMDALAAARAVVASDVGGIKTLIQQGRNGLLVPPGDERPLAEAIIGLLADPGKRNYLGNNGREFIKSNFSLEKMASETERVYLECVAAK